ncbi:hypothetical protein ACC817_28605 [Rhizobium ruizarguesonis]|jgi:hypothetical protein
MTVIDGAATPFKPAAMYFHDSDCVEYIKVDAFAIYDRIDEFLTLVYDKGGKEPIGFKLKGFKHVFTTMLSPVRRLNESQFLRLATAIEAVCLKAGEELFEDPHRGESYRAAYKLAANDNVELSEADFEIAV